MKKIFFAVLLVSGLSLDSFSQVVNIYKISPQHLSVNTLMVTWERASSPYSKTSLNISPFVTYYERTSSPHVNEKLAGAGLELGRKIYVSKVDSASPLSGWYASGSLTFAYYAADYQKSNDSSIAYNPNNGYGYGYYNVNTSTGRYYHETIQKIGADIFIGYQVPFKNVFYLDFFFGAGMRYGISSEGDKTNYKDRLIDIAHSGIIPKIGVKFGLRF